LTNSIYHEEYGHFVEEVSPLQIFGLVASLLACAILGIWSAILACSLATGKAPWRPQRGFSNAPAASSTMERNDSGIVLVCSATMEHGRSTSSYYMTEVRHREYTHIDCTVKKRVYHVWFLRQREPVKYD
jgi:hypothetical protein